MGATFEELLAEGSSVPLRGWDFSWFDGRATEERPSWGYTSLAVPRVAGARSVLDVQTGGGEVFAEMLGRVPAVPPALVATESHRPNVALAARALAPFGAWVVDTADEAGLPFAGGRFELILSRHPTVTRWDEVARTLAPGGTYLSQQVGAGSNRELSDFMMGPQPVSDRRSASRARTEAERSGLTVVDLREQSLRAVFDDVAAVVVFLRMVVWTVPGFTVARYRNRLRSMHERIESEGPFVSHAERFLIEAVKPADRR